MIELKVWYTIITAIDPIDGELKKWEGEFILANTKAEATEWIRMNNKGYMKVIGQRLGAIAYDIMVFSQN